MNHKVNAAVLLVTYQVTYAAAKAVAKKRRLRLTVPIDPKAEEHVLSIQLLKRLIIADSQGVPYEEKAEMFDIDQKFIRQITNSY